MCFVFLFVCLFVLVVIFVVVVFGERGGGGIVDYCFLIILKSCLYLFSFFENSCITYDKFIHPLFILSNNDLVFFKPKMVYKMKIG